VRAPATLDVPLEQVEPVPSALAGDLLLARIDGLSVTFGERLASLFTRAARRRILARPAG
jgi:hypothetical protein